MQLNRRHFIKLVLGGAAGIHMTPLPWKLMDDSAIWTQNWPWVPVPEVGAFSEIDSVCTLCPGGCGIKVRMVDGRAVKIEGRTDYPVNPGGICPLGSGGLQLLYNEDLRFTAPAKRVGPRGSGQFVDISWDEALKQVIERVSALRARKTPEALVALDGNPGRSTASLLIQRFLQAVGSPNYTRIPSAEDTYAMMNHLMQGSDGPMAYDLENADFVLSFGCGLIEGWGSPGRMINAWGLWRSEPLKGKVQIVQIESRASNTASKADRWLAPVPGTEGVLALGLAHVMVQEGLYDADFVSRHTSGFEDATAEDGTRLLGFRNYVRQKYAPGKVAEMTGLKPEDIVALARDFARAKAPIALCGRGKGDLPDSLLECMAVHSLNALVGNINRPGGPLVHQPLPLRPWPAVAPDALAQEGLAKARLDRAGSADYPFARSLVDNLSRVILDSDSSPVDTLLVFSANPCYTLPDGGDFRKAVEKIPFVVSFSPFRDETAYMADLILPDHMALEKREDLVWPAGLAFPFFGLSKPVVEPLYQTRHQGDTVIELAQNCGDAVGSAFPWANYEEALKARVEGLVESEGGLTSYDEAKAVWTQMAQGGDVEPDYEDLEDLWEKLREGGFWYRPAHAFKSWDTCFRTPSGKFEFGNAAMVSRLKGRGGKGGSQAGTGEYPLRVLPYEMINLSTGWLPNPHFLYKTLFEHQVREFESVAEINPETAAAYHLKQGDRIVIESPKGSLRARVDLFEGAMPEILYLPMGLGHWAYDAYHRGKGVNPNAIIDGEEDPLSGHKIWWRTRVRIRKA